MVRVGGDVSGLESSMRTAGQAVVSMAKLVAGATAAAGAGVIALGKIGVEYNSQMENYTTNFRVMLGDQEKAVAKMAQLKDMAASTPFELGALADATQTLLAFQVPAQQTTDVLKMLGDVSLGDNTRLAGLATVFGQVSSAGKLTGQDLMQMINNGFNPLNYISQRTGESMAELRDRMSEGAVSAEEVTQAFQDATSAGGQFYNGMAEASKTMSGLISTLKDNARSLVGEVFVPISDGIKNTLLPQAIGYISDLTTAFREKGVSGLVVAAGEVLSGVITTIAEGAPRFVEFAVSLVNSLLDGIISNLPAIVDAATQVVLSLADGILNMLPKIIEAGLEIIIRLAQGIADALPELVPTIVDTVVTIVDTLIEHANELLDAGLAIILALVDGLTEALPQLIDRLPEIIDKIVNEITNIDNLTNIIDAGVTLFVSLVGNIPDIIIGISEKIPEIVDNIADKFTSEENLEKMRQAGKTLLNAIFDVQPNIIRGALNLPSVSDTRDYLNSLQPGEPIDWDAARSYYAPEGSGGGGESSGSGSGRGGGTENTPNISTMTRAFVPTGYASGGNPARGELFYADENNVYEFKGSAGGSPTVANNSQMEEAVATGNREVVMVLERIANILSSQNGSADFEGLNRALRSSQSRYDAITGRSLA